MCATLCLKCSCTAKQNNAHVCCTSFEMLMHCKTTLSLRQIAISAHAYLQRASVLLNMLKFAYPPLLVDPVLIMAYLGINHTYTDYFTHIHTHPIQHTILTSIKQTLHNTHIPLNVHIHTTCTLTQPPSSTGTETPPPSSTPAPDCMHE